MALLPDVELAQLSADGDRAAYAELVKRAAGPTRDLLRRMGAQPALADDLLQDALLTGLRRVSTYRGEAPFAGWVMTIAARLFLRRRRKDARLELMADPVDAATPDAWREDGQIARLDLDRALRELSPAERMCVSLCHGGGLTHDEIATALRVPVGTVKSHVRRGVQKLRARLGAEETPA